MLKKVAIIGSGSWATALVKIFSDSGVHVSWMVRNDERAAFIRDNGYNPRYLSYASLNMDYIRPSADPASALPEAELVLFAVPSAFLKESLNNLDSELLSSKRLAVSIKGFVPYTGKIPSTYIKDVTGNDKPVVVLGGPCHAEEVAMQKSTYLTVSGTDSKYVQKIGSSFGNGFLKVILNSDPSGIEYTAILKNIIGIATGIAKGLNYGDNFQAVLVSNAMRETECFLTSIEPGKRDIYNSAYFGDLLVTAYSDYSRNRTLGKLVGRGIQVSNALQAMEMIAEGFHASRELAPIVKELDISLPVFNSVYRILHLQANPYHEFKLLEKYLC